MLPENSIQTVLRGKLIPLCSTIVVQLCFYYFCNRIRWFLKFRLGKKAIDWLVKWIVCWGFHFPLIFHCFHINCSHRTLFKLVVQLISEEFYLKNFFDLVSQYAISLNYVSFCEIYWDLRVLLHFFVLIFALTFYRTAIFLKYFRYLLSVYTSIYNK